MIAIGVKTQLAACGAMRSDPERIRQSAESFQLLVGETPKMNAFFVLKYVNGANCDRLDLFYRKIHMINPLVFKIYFHGSDQILGVQCKTAVIRMQMAIGKVVNIVRDHIITVDMDKSVGDNFLNDRITALMEISGSADRVTVSTPKRGDANYFFVGEKSLNGLKFLTN